MRDLHIETSGGGNVVAARCDDVIAFGQRTFRGFRAHFERNAEIFGAGEPADHVYRLVKGAVRIVRYTGEGRRQILTFQMPGDIFGYDLGASHDFTAEAVNDCEVVMVRRCTIDNGAAEDVRLARTLVEFARTQALAAQEHALVLGLKGAGERVAAFLLQFAERFAGRAELDLPMSRLDIADYLALTIESVSRAFTQMERENRIALPTSRHVLVTDRRALEALQAA
jgi:CRP/FNR family nitrogen fixation transcriptional regulator